MGENKNERILSIFSALSSGEVVQKTPTAAKYGVNERTVQRDIDDIRAFYANNSLEGGHGKSVVYDRTYKGYRLIDDDRSALTNSEILAVCKILLESRSLVKEEMMPIIDKLVTRCVPEQNKRAVWSLIGNEKFHYVEPHHGVKFVDKLWDIGTAIREQRIIEIEYTRLKEKKTVTRRLQPVGIMVSEFYFYLTAFIDDIDRCEHFDNPDDLYPTIYRIDRIQSMKITDERFYVPYADKFEEGEFRKRVQFMYGGKLQKVRFTYSGPSIEAVLDRLPTAQIIDEKDGVYTVEAETFGKGIEMWLRGQGENLKTII